MMHRPTIGIIALALLATGSALAVWPSEEAGTLQWKSACWRIGAVMAALWIAQPQLHLLPRWSLPALLVLVLILARSPRLLPLAILVLVAVALLRPRPARQHGATAAGKSRSQS